MVALMAQRSQKMRMVVQRRRSSLAGRVLYLEEVAGPAGLQMMEVERADSPDRRLLKRRIGRSLSWLGLNLEPKLLASMQKA